MKKYNLIAAIALIVAGKTLIAMDTNPVNVILENSYGWPIKYKITRMDKLGPELTLNANKTESLGDIGNIQGIIIWSATSIREYSLANQLNEIRNQAYKHRAENAIINLATYYGNWTPTVYWRKIGEEPGEASKKENIWKEVELLTLSNAEARLTAIKNGALGAEYAQKVEEICSADYTAALQKGLLNLCGRLKNTLMEPKFIIKPSKEILEELKKAGTSPKYKNFDLTQTIHEIKESINLIRRSLDSYRAKGNAQ